MSRGSVPSYKDKSVKLEENKISKHMGGDHSVAGMAKTLTHFLKDALKHVPGKAVENIKLG